MGARRQRQKPRRDATGAPRQPVIIDPRGTEAQPFRVAVREHGTGRATLRSRVCRPVSPSETLNPFVWCSDLPALRVFPARLSRLSRLPGCLPRLSRLPGCPGGGTAQVVRPTRSSLASSAPVAGPPGPLPRLGSSRVGGVGDLGGPVGLTGIGRLSGLGHARGAQSPVDDVHELVRAPSMIGSDPPIGSAMAATLTITPHRGADEVLVVGRVRLVAQGPGRHRGGAEQSGPGQVLQGVVHGGASVGVARPAQLGHQLVGRPVAAHLLEHGEQGEPGARRPEAQPAKAGRVRRRLMHLPDVFPQIGRRETSSRIGRRRVTRRRHAWW